MTRGEYMENLARPTKMPTLGIFNPLNAELNPICHLLALLGAHRILHVSRLRVKSTDRFNLKAADLFIPFMATRHEVLSTPLREGLIIKAIEIFIQKCRLSRTDL